MSVPRKIAMEFSWVSEIIAFSLRRLSKSKGDKKVVVVDWGGERAMV